MPPLPRSFYTRDDVVAIARELLGKILVTRIDGLNTRGIIVETEAYAGVSDRASHAYGGRRTARTEQMYATGGSAYVYLCYGMHRLFNVVTNVADTPHAVLIRAVEPQSGADVMSARRGGIDIDDPMLTAGPGRMSAALGIAIAHNGTDLIKGPIRIHDAPACSDADLVASPRVGIGYAGADISKPWRFRIKDSRWTSPAA